MKKHMDGIIESDQIVSEWISLIVSV